jgi:toxin ParE1/3/4
MPHKVRLSDDAKAHLRAIRSYIAKESSKRIALNYVRQITAACLALETFPQRGTNRDDLLRGLRTVGFDGRVSIAFRVRETSVDILAILYGGRDVETYFKSRVFH